ncbi:MULTISPECIES: glycoside hydrolase family 108 protein [Yersinia]|uniref:glycoside hydrolase family 108 protein n=1 Tax=Yersinia TaxID=629 RepID=UPI000C1584AA|nr:MULTISPECIES: glycosyl hydrolase 108 family protein [Yersinia]EKN3738809.1 glycoside hydrolase family 108 protein [Yersinia enterocolitica]MDA5523334.1 glycosyl hydrolase 108 family protein [Yersinia kristensenii]MDA5544608.1 glycoside hydrolase family 108 protein [Yersinia rochesterensis]PHZ36569.1 peptidoglycan-binding protein [Yersinia kristensenii]UZM75973.1 glycoside hydrolase family 108 protein [Yersinia sp. SCPM-O-B-9106 (C-191)]
MTPYSVTFIHAIDYMLAAEGGYVNDPTDKGGETKYGISKRSYPTLNIATLTPEQATEIYFRDYWLKVRCDQLPAGISLAMFDGVVQHGYKTAIQQLQRALRVVDDGVIGAKTLAAVEAVMPRLLFARLMNQRSQTYTRIIANSPVQIRFMNGWFNRLDKLTTAVWEVL